MIEQYMPLVLSLAANAQDKVEPVARETSELPPEARAWLVGVGVALILVAIVIEVIKNKIGDFYED